MTYLGEAPRLGDMRLEGYRQKVWTGENWVTFDERVCRLLMARRALSAVTDLMPESAPMLAAIDALFKEATA